MLWFDLWANQCHTQATTPEESVEYLQSEEERDMSKFRMKGNETKWERNDKMKILKEKD